MSVFKIGGFGFHHYKSLNEIASRLMTGDTVQIKTKSLKLTETVSLPSGVYIEGIDTVITTPPRRIGLRLIQNGDYHFKNLIIASSAQSIGLLSQATDQRLTFENVHFVHTKKINQREIRESMILNPGVGKYSTSMTCINSSIDYLNAKLWSLSAQQCSFGDAFIVNPSIIASTANNIDNSNVQNIQFLSSIENGQTTIRNSKVGAGVVSAAESNENSERMSVINSVVTNLPSINHNGLPTKQEREVYDAKNYAALTVLQNGHIYITGSKIMPTDDKNVEKINETDKWSSFLVNNGGYLELSKMTIADTPNSNNAIAGKIQMRNVTDESQWLLNNYKNVTLSNQNSQSLLFSEAQKQRQAAMNASDTSNQIIAQADYSAMAELKKLIGLASVKTWAEKLISNAKMDHEMIRRGMSTAKNAMSLHAVFEGSPGTGKTTVANLLGKALYENGVLKSGNMIKATQPDLVDDVVGGTALKTRRVVMKALGGILFIDEAYSLAPKQGTSFNDEAVAELIKLGEDHRDNLMIIMAGYTTNMEHFFKVGNPGLRSRFDNKIIFPDYSPEELVRILHYNFHEQHLLVSEKSVFKAVDDGMLSLLKYAGNNFGNARFVRNYAQKVVFAKNYRISQQYSNLAAINDDSVLRTITLEDVRSATETMKEQLSSNLD